MGSEMCIRDRIKIDSYPTGVVPQEYSYIFLNQGPTYYEYRIMLYSGGRVDGAFLNGADWGTSYVLSNTVLNLNEWYHIVYTYDKAIHRIYINGKEDNTKADGTGGKYFSGGEIAIGGHRQIYAGSRMFDGLIDEVKVYNRALSAEEIRYHYNRGGPVAHWKFDEGNGTTTFDGTDNNNDGTLGDGTCFPGSATCPSWQQGKYGSALLFDGVDDYVLVPDSTSLRVASEFTIEGWFKFNDLSITSDMFRKMDNVGAVWRGFYIACSSSGQIQLRYGSSVADQWYTNIYSPAVGIWNHYAFVYSGGKISVYVDGVQKLSPSTAPYEDSADNLKIGHRGIVNQGMHGLIDDVRIYNYTRTPEQIRQDYNAGLGTHFK